MKQTGWTTAGILGAMVVVALAVTSRGKAATKTVSPPPPAVTIVRIEGEDVATYREYPARTYARDLVEVRGRVDGYLDQRTFDIGSDVRAGQVLYVLDVRPYEAEVERARGALAQSVADIAQAEATLERPQGRPRIGERRPVTDRVGKPGLFSCGRREAQALAKTPNDRHQQLAIRRVGTSLGCGFQLGVERQESLGVGRDTMVRQDRLQGGEEACLPVDQRPVAVEGEHPLGREVDQFG